MSVEQYQRTVNRLEKEIADLEKKKADKDKSIAILQSKIISLKRSINKHTSPNSLAKKIDKSHLMNQIKPKKAKRVQILKKR